MSWMLLGVAEIFKPELELLPQKSKQGSGGAGTKCREVAARSFLKALRFPTCPIERVGHIGLDQVPFQVDPAGGFQDEYECG
jgi:hypothetical protein